VMGSPGKVIRQVTEEEKKSFIENAQHYIDNWKRYVNDLKKI
ncbi:MAG: gamma carbonic anhydrase family protein, partial [Candidatus Fonsibacter ubiquis]